MRDITLRVADEVVYKVMDSGREYICTLGFQRKVLTIVCWHSGRSLVLYALCGVSCAGKTTILKRLLQQEPLLERLVTTTTRLPRAGEVDQVDYHFVSVAQFQAAVHVGQIVCPIFYRDAWYGTASDDLAVCAAKEVVGVLCPDKIHELQRFTPLLGIYISRPERRLSLSPDDEIIVAHQHLCQYQVTNVYGKLDDTVDEILALLSTHRGGT